MLESKTSTDKKQLSQIKSGDSSNKNNSLQSSEITNGIITSGYITRIDIANNIITDELKNEGNNEDSSSSYPIRTIKFIPVKIKDVGRVLQNDQAIGLPQPLDKEFSQQPLNQIIKLNLENKISPHSKSSDPLIGQTSDKNNVKISVSELYGQNPTQTQNVLAMPHVQAFPMINNSEFQIYKGSRTGRNKSVNKVNRNRSRKSRSRFQSNLGSNKNLRRNKKSKSQSISGLKPKDRSRRKYRSVSKSRSRGKNVSISKSRSRGNYVSVSKSRSHRNSRPISKLRSHRKSRPISNSRSRRKSRPISNSRSRRKSRFISKSRSSGKSGPISKSRSRRKSGSICKSRSHRKAQSISKSRSRRKSRSISKSRSRNKSGPICILRPRHRSRTHQRSRPRRTSRSRSRSRFCYRSRTRQRSRPRCTSRSRSRSRFCYRSRSRGKNRSERRKLKDYSSTRSTPPVVYKRQIEVPKLKYDQPCCTPYPLCETDCNISPPSPAFTMNKPLYRANNCMMGNTECSPRHVEKELGQNERNKLFLMLHDDDNDIGTPEKCCKSKANLAFIQPGTCPKRKKMWINEYAIIPQHKVNMIDPCEELDPIIHPRANKPCIRDSRGNPLTDCIGRPLRDPNGMRFLRFNTNGSVMDTDFRGNFYSGQPPLCMKHPLPTCGCAPDTTHNWWLDSGHPIQPDMSQYFRQVARSRRSS